jgi:major vault protein
VKNKDDPNEAAMLFSVPDFVGDACKAIASRIRGSVAGVQFDDFHKVSFCHFVVSLRCRTDCLTEVVD